MVSQGLKENNTDTKGMAYTKKRFVNEAECAG